MAFYTILLRVNLSWPIITTAIIVATAAAAAAANDEYDNVNGYDACRHASRPYFIT